MEARSRATLPIYRSDHAATKFEFVICRKTAKTLGLTIPPTLLAQTEQVLE